MSTEQLPDINSPFNACMYRDGCRAEHAQRVTLQHHAVDQAQRIADLEAERDMLKRIVGAYSPQKELFAALTQAKESGRKARQERDELARGHRSQHDADSTELRRVCADRDAARKERDELRAQISACKPHLRERLDGMLESPASMLALREAEVLGLLGRLSAAQIQVDELRAKLAEIEGQECLTVEAGEWRTMSIDKSIGELIAAASGSGEGLVSVENVTLAQLRLRDLIATVIADARREGAEQMRAEAAKIARALPLYYGSGDDGADESLAQEIEDLPLPTGPRQAVRLTDGQITALVDGYGWTVAEALIEDIPEMAREIETAVLAANGIGGEND